MKLTDLLEISPVEAGLQTVAWLHGKIDAESAAVAAAKRNVDVTPLNRYSHGTPLREGLPLGFAALDAKEIRRGVRELVQALSTTQGLRRAGDSVPCPTILGLVSIASKFLLVSRSASHCSCGLPGRPPGIPAGKTMDLQFRC